ncbi:MAG: hypothetical protein IT376_02460 [Polyangiaceae bacterium]|nr:hypothetical protein [Polyangiaceae bacterium]
MARSWLRVTRGRVVVLAVLGLAAGGFFAARAGWRWAQHRRPNRPLPRLDPVTVVPDAASACPSFSKPERVATIGAPGLEEASGLAASTKNPGVFWTHNDSGDAARGYALALDGRILATLEVERAGAHDWEDVAIAPGPGGAPHLYFADTGNNVLPRRRVVVYRVAEPTIDSTTTAAALRGEATPLPLELPDAAPHDCEAILVDPPTGALYLFSKTDAAVTGVFVARAPRDREPTQLAEALALRLPRRSKRGSGAVTAASIAPAGELVAVRTYAEAYLWRRQPGEPLEAALARPPCEAPVAAERQGEAIALLPGGDGFVTVTETGPGQPPPLHLVRWSP